MCEDKSRDTAAAGIESARPAANGQSAEQRGNGDAVAIIGSGIAGMTAALALAKNNIPSVIYEKTALLQEVGAGIQLAPNAVRLLQALDLEPALRLYAAEPDSVALSSGDSGKILLRLPIKTWAAERWRAPYLTVHRADMQKLLKQAIDDNPLIASVSGADIEKVSGNAQRGFVLHFAVSGEQKTARAGQILCCDGVWSRLRAALCAEEASFSSYIAWRATIGREDMPQEFFSQNGANSVSAFMSENSHFIIYPLRKGAVYNFVAVTKGANIGKTWAREGDKIELLRLFSGKSGLLRRLIARAPGWTFWPLFQMPFPRFLSRDGVIFLGDAAHAVTPFAAQGAAMAIEDACAAAEMLAARGGAEMLAARGGAEKTPSAAALRHFDTVRQERLKAVAGRGNFNRFVYHLSGPAALARNLVFRLRRPAAFAADLDWLYGYDAAAPFLPQKQSAA